MESVKVMETLVEIVNRHSCLLVMAAGAKWHLLAGESHVVQQRSHEGLSS